jgi:histidinol-phosphatase (PHP family)
MTNPAAPLIDISRDGHVHTYLCRHALGTMEEYVQAAITKGLHGIVFLEHMESGIDYFATTWLSEKDFDTFFEEGERLQKKYQDRLEIGLGVEVGYNPEQKDELAARLAKRNWDRIGISFHYFKHPDLPHHLNLVSRKEWNIDAMAQAGGNALLDHYFNTLLEGVLSLPGTVLCHLDAGLRYLPGLRLEKNHVKKIAVLLDAVKDKGMELEINTSGIPIRGEPFPAAPFVEMAINRGISLVAGSDAHRPEDVGRYFKKLPEFLNAKIHP